MEFNKTLWLLSSTLFTTFSYFSRFKLSQKNFFLFYSRKICFELLWTQRSERKTDEFCDAEEIFFSFLFLVHQCCGKEIFSAQIIHVKLHACWTFWLGWGVLCCWGCGELFTSFHDSLMSSIFCVNEEKRSWCEQRFENCRQILEFFWIFKSLKLKI